MKQQQTDIQPLETFAFTLLSLAFANNSLIFKCLTRFAKAVKAKSNHRNTRVRARGAVFSLRRAADVLTFEAENPTSKVEFPNSEAVVFFPLSRLKTGHRSVQKTRPAFSFRAKQARRGSVFPDIL
ncbi:hypothetical protein [Alloprevotella sp. OH1205_COT-284]|uniref:hypothetical protein n=1 Tax=Alloprevotella sp. OH1205_COT-284 TaxID=2491043 RepID=UPI000F5E8FA9|nr:hypothetical protein [Alloprevotella sp. OH1205_COT-284]